MYKDTKKKKNTTSTDVFSILAELIFYVSCSKKVSMMETFK